jgi:hypothetical protein
MKKFFIILLFLFSIPVFSKNTETIESNIVRLKTYLDVQFSKSPNNYTTRDEAQEFVTQFFHDLAFRHFLEAWIVVCDEDNNPPDVIKNHKLIIDVYYQEHIDSDEPPKFISLVVENKP